MKRYRITLEEHTFDITVLDDPRQAQVRVEVDGETFTVGVEDLPVTEERPTKFSETSEISGRPRETEGRLPKVSTNTISSPLPGVIKSIAVRPGQRVAANDELLVIEAMKMDNVIRTPREGTVGTIYVVEGRQVAYGEPLLEMNNEQ